MQLFRNLIVFAGMAISTQALAIFDAQLLVGKRSGDAEDASSKAKEPLAGTEIQAAFHIDPIPLVPVAFGLYAAQGNYEFDDTAAGKMTGLEVGAQVYAWFPLGIAGLKPYAKLGYPLFSAIKRDVEIANTLTYSTVVKASGPHIGVGLGYGLPVLPVALLLEFDMGRQTLKEDDVEIKSNIGSVSIAAQEFTWNSTAILFGVQAGL